MFNYKLLIAYDGTHYCGWQVQPNGCSIQENIEKAIQIMLHEKVGIIGSGRTDAGVHALGQVAHFHTSYQIDTHRFCRSLNALLPFDIRIKEVEAVPFNFHAQYGAKGKIYHYHLHLDLVQNPFNRLYSYHVRYKINLDKLKEAATYFIGTHDFSAFANHNFEGVASYDSIRSLHRLDIVSQEGGVRLEFEGDGFLYKMVRTIVGTLLEISRGKRQAQDIPNIFVSGDRRRAGIVAPAHALFLVKVIY